MISLKSLAGEKWSACFESELPTLCIQCLCLSKVHMLTPNPQSDQLRDGGALRQDWLIMTEPWE